MCGKFTQMASWRQIHQWSDLLGQGRPDGGDADAELLVTPMRAAQVLHLDAMGRRATSAMRWGFPGPQAAGSQDPPKFIHARAETVDSKPTFAESFRERRGIVPVRSFNEGETVGRRIVQHRIRPKDGKPLGIAVIWREWLFPDGEILDCFVMITVEPNSLIRTITDRMPAILAEGDWPTWLGETPASREEIKALLRTVEGDWEMVRESPRTTGKGKADRPPPDPLLF